VSFLIVQITEKWLIHSWDRTRIFGESSKGPLHHHHGSQTYHLFISKYFIRSIYVALHQSFLQWVSWFNFTKHFEFPSFSRINRVQTRIKHLYFASNSKIQIITKIAYTQGKWCVTKKQFTLKPTSSDCKLFFHKSKVFELIWLI